MRVVDGTTGNSAWFDTTLTPIQKRILIQYKTIEKKATVLPTVAFFFIVILYDSSIAIEDILEISNELLQTKLITAFFRCQVYLNKLFHNRIRYVFHI